MWTSYDQLKLLTKEALKCDSIVKRMAGVFDIELHEGDSVNQDESDDDILESREVRFYQTFDKFFCCLCCIFHSFSFFSGWIQSCHKCKYHIRVSIIAFEGQRHWPYN